MTEDLVTLKYFPQIFHFPPRAILGLGEKLVEIKASLIIVDPLGALSPLWAAALLKVLAAECAGTAERTLLSPMPSLQKVSSYIRSYFPPK